MMMWAMTQINKWQNGLFDAIKNGDDHAAGVLAARITCWTNAIARVRSGRSVDLVTDPVFGRSMNIVEYFNNPRAATPGDDLGIITDWSVNDAPDALDLL